MLELDSKIKILVMSPLDYDGQYKVKGHCYGSHMKYLPQVLALEKLVLAYIIAFRGKGTF